MKKCNAPAREALEYVEQSFPRVLIDGVWATRFKVDDSKFIDVLCEYEKGGVGYKSVLTHAPPPSKGEIFDAYRRKHFQLETGSLVKQGPSTETHQAQSHKHERLARASTLVE